jgi:hypothetical protein
MEMKMKKPNDFFTRSNNPAKTRPLTDVEKIFGRGAAVMGKKPVPPTPPKAKATKR